MADNPNLPVEDTQTSLFSIPPDWEEQWQNMPEFVQVKQRPFAQLIIRFRNQRDLDDFASRIGQRLNRQSQCTWHPELAKGELGNSGKKYIDDES